MLSFLTVGKSILFDGLSKKPRRVLPARGTRHPQGGRAASGCPGRPQAANNFNRFLPRHVRGRKHFARSERRIVRYQRTTEAQNAAKLSRKSGKATFSTVSAAVAIDCSGCFLCSGASSRKVSIPRRTVSCSGNAPFAQTHSKRYAFARLSCKTPCGIINHRK